MDTMIFSTCYFKGKDEVKKWITWFEYYRSIIPNIFFFIIDDGSDLNFLKYYDSYFNMDNTVLDLNKINFYSFKKHLGRFNVCHYGWMRSFSYSIEIANKMNFDRIIHFEVDFFILRKKFLDYVLSINSGWNAAWCPLYEFVESACQVICIDEYETVLTVCEEMRTKWKIFDCEKIEDSDLINDFLVEINFMKYCNVFTYLEDEKEIIGDRYGESNISISNKMDFYAQYFCNHDFNEKPIMKFEED